MVYNTPQQKFMGYHLKIATRFQLKNTYKDSDMNIE